jgi:hypothetical protein
VLAALIIVWVTIGIFTVDERSMVIERAQTQLALTTSTLADFNELAQQRPAQESNGSGSRSAAIWRAPADSPDWRTGQPLSSARLWDQ